MNPTFHDKCYFCNSDFSDNSFECKEFIKNNDKEDPHNYYLHYFQFMTLALTEKSIIFEQNVDLSVKKHIRFDLCEDANYSSWIYSDVTNKEKCIFIYRIKLYCKKCESHVTLDEHFQIKDISVRFSHKNKTRYMLYSNRDNFAREIYSNHPIKIKMSLEDFKNKEYLAELISNYELIN